MSQSGFTSLFSKSSAIQELARASAGENSRILLSSLPGSALALAAALTLSKSNYLFLLGDKEEAAYLYNDLSNLLVDEDILFFPSSYKRSIQYGHSDPSGIIQRTGVLSRMKLSQKEANGSRLIIVSYPEALSEKIPAQEQMDKNTLVLSVGEKISITFTVEVLQEYGFERVDFVFEPGQYSVRGGIVDVFSYSNNRPYRIDYFGDEVESIREFDIESQLSSSKVNKIAIVPHVSAELDGEKMVSLLSYLGSNTQIWLKDGALFKERVASLYQLTEESREPGEDNPGWRHKSGVLITEKEFASVIAKSSLVEFGQHPIYRDGVTIHFNMAPQPSFNKNFELLAKNLEESTQNGYITYILSDNENQTLRLKEVIAQTCKEPVTVEFIKVNIHEGFIDKELKVACYTDHQLFERYHRFRIKGEYNRSEALTIQEINNLQPGDYVVHIDHGIGTFAGLVRTNENGRIQEAVRLVYRDNDVLLVNIHNLHRISKFRGKDGEPPKINKLGTGAWQKLKQATKKKVKDIAKDLIALYAKRKAQHGFAFSPDTYMQQELEASFIYEDTPDQLKTTKTVKEDMEQPIPMDRLVCGDVGFGKTEIAIRAAFKAVADSKQVAILVPTTILALQHYKTFKNRLADFPCKIDYVSRLRSAKEQKATLEEVASGKVDIIIGTHKLLGKEIKFKDLGLLVIDEEQKFGVSAKEKLRQLKESVDTLTLTATPIPRTLQFSLMGARDLSTISTPPPNRYPIATELHIFNENIIRDAINYELDRGGQVFFLHNRVANIHEIENYIKRICPTVKTVAAHGQMEGALLEKTMLAFIEGEYDVLVSTTIIEAGLDIPNANTIIINNAHMHGLSDLHQLRGRVGRTNRKAFCYLLAPPPASLTAEARRRLKAIEEFSDLGSGFNIAMQDLEIRGAGNLLGGEQSGFIADIGFETYHKILNEAIQEMKEDEFKDLFKEEMEKQLVEGTHNFVQDCHIETDMDIMLPDSYIGSTTEKINLYRELDSLQDDAAVQKFEAMLNDRFGTPPAQVSELLNVVRLRWNAMRLGFEKVVLKNGFMVANFIGNQMSPFYTSKAFANTMTYVQHNSRRFKMKETTSKLSLVVENTRSVEEALALTNKMLEAIHSETTTTNNTSQTKKQ